MIKLSHLLKNNLKEMKYKQENGYSDKAWLRQLKRDRDRWEDAKNVRYQMLEGYKPSPLDPEINKLDIEIDKAIWRGIGQNNSRDVTKLLSKQHKLIMQSIGLDNEQSEKK